jgi:tetratricopeptide (TPR) repeat protein
MISKCSDLALALALTIALALALPSIAGAEPAGPEAQARSDAEALAAATAQEGIELFKQARYAEALVVFERSFQHARVPVVAWNMARCHEELEHPDEAIAFFERFRELSPDDDKKQIATTKIDRLLQRYYATLSITVEPAGAEVLLDGKSAGLAPLQSVRVRVGTHDVLLRLAGYEPQKRVVQVAPGQSFAFTFTLAALPALVVLDAPEPVGGLVVVVDGVRVATVAAPARFQVTPGVHTIEVQAGPEWVPLRHTATVGAGEEATLKLVRASSVVAGVTANPAPVVIVKRDPTVRLIEAKSRGKGRSYSTVASVVLGVGLAAAGAGGVLHVVGYARWKDVTGAKTDANGYVSGVTRADAVSIADSARLKYTIAYGLYGLGAAAITTSIVLFALSASDEASASLAPLPLQDGAGLSFSGRF